MTTFFVTRHRGAVDWARAQKIDAEHVVHFDSSTTRPGDVVMGTLPVSDVATICARGGRYFHLVLRIPKDARGRELTAADMQSFGAHLIEYEARKVEKA